MVVLFTLIEILIGLAILVVLGILAVWAWLASKKVNSSGGSSSGSGPEIFKLRFTNPPPKENEPDKEFEKDTQATFVVKTEKWHAGTMSYKAHGDQDSFVGIVDPASVTVVSINGSPPGTSETVSGIPVDAYKTSSKPDGTITIILQGSEPADGMLSVFYVPSSEGLKTAQADFSITDN